MALPLIPPTGPASTDCVVRPLEEEAMEARAQPAVLDGDSTSKGRCTICRVSKVRDTNRIGRPEKEWLLCYRHCHVGDQQHGAWLVRA
jgi:hypothetical protein